MNIGNYSNIYIFNFSLQADIIVLNLTRGRVWVWAEPSKKNTEKQNKKQTKQMRINRKVNYENPDPWW